MEWCDGRRYRFSGAALTYPAIILAVILASAIAQAQITADEIESLRQKGIEEGWTFTVGENPATQRPLEDLFGLVVPDNWESMARFESFETRRLFLPGRFDWRDSVLLSPTKDQGPCGSCWAFATVGALECNIAIRDGIEVDLSEQYLVSCNDEGWGCSGGYFAHDYHMWKPDPCGDSGAVLETDFPYVADELDCNCPYTIPRIYFINDWAFVAGREGMPAIGAIKTAIMEYGPVSVGMHADVAFVAYTSGVFNGCSDGPRNHAVVLVGWDDNQGDGGVWFLRNSYGPDWGEDGGYMRIEYDCSSIGWGASFIEYLSQNPDADADGVINTEDNCPWVYNPDQWNSDDDEYGDSCDVCPLSTDNDRDYDGLCGADDNCPYHYNVNQSDNDGDGIGDSCDVCPDNYDPGQEDEDYDGAGDLCDNCLGVYNPSQGDVNGDGIGDMCDPDADSDGIPNDGDGSGTRGDNNCYGGNTVACDDNCWLTPNPDQADSDNNGIGDDCDYLLKFAEWTVAGGGNGHYYAVIPMEVFWDVADSMAGHRLPVGWDGHLVVITSEEENDYILNTVLAGLDPPMSIDYFWLGGKYLTDTGWTWVTGEPFDYDNWTDFAPHTDSIRNRNVMKADTEPYLFEIPPGSWINVPPNDFPYWAIIEWENLADIDGDGVDSTSDNCPYNYNPGQEDSDGDLLGDACDYDDDEDGIPDTLDNCSLTYNPDQADNDNDGVGDLCDDDDDDDGIADTEDNCQFEYNPGQEDINTNEIGDACEPECGFWTGGITGNANCSDDGKLTLSDITRLIDRVYISKAALCCEASGNTNGDAECKITLSDITVLIDAVYISKNDPQTCMPECEQ